MRLFRAARIPVVVALVIGGAVAVTPPAAASGAKPTPTRPARVKTVPARVQAARQSAFNDRSADATAALASTTSSEAQLASAASQAGVVEAVAQRTATSRTFATPVGAMETVIGEAPLNYQNGGSWSAINDTLTSDPTSGFAWRTTANSYLAEFPSSLAAGPVRIISGGQWVSFALAGASSATGVVSGTSITYPNALTGVSVTYTATPTGVKETLSLASATSQAAFSYALTMSSGLQATLDSANAVLIAASEDLFARVDPPWAVDAGSGRTPTLSVLDTTLRPVTGGYTLGVAVDPAWMASADRVFPVTVDPTIRLNTSTSQSASCPILSGQPTLYNCGQTYSVVGYKADTSKIRRALAQFSFTGIPDTSTVLSADYGFYFSSLTDAASVDVDFYRNAQNWDQASATWNNAVGSTAWSPSAGGTPTGTQVFSTIIHSTDTGYQRVYLTAMVQGWVDHTNTNQGMLIKAASETTTGLFTFNDSHSTTNLPFLNVFWSAHTGDDTIQTVLNRSLSDKTSLGVNPADGNVLLSTTDMSTAGTGPGSNLSFKHFYNSADGYVQSGISGTAISQLGAGWVADNTLDSKVTRWNTAAGYSASVVMPGGVTRVFTRTKTDNNWTAPDGVNGDFSRDDANQITTLVDHDSGLTYTWTDVPGSTQLGQLTSIKTQVSNTIALSNVSSTLEEITDTKGNLFDETLGSVVTGGPKVLKSINDVTGGRTVSFGYNTSGQLSKVTDATGAETDYFYNASGLLNEIKDPVSGHDAVITYYGIAPNPPGSAWTGRVQDITQTTTDCANGTTVQNYKTGYTYYATGGGVMNATGETDISDPAGRTSKYYWDTKHRVVEAIDPAGNKQDSSYNATTGRISTFTDALTAGVTNIDYAGKMVSAVTEPATGTSGRAKNSITAYSVTNPASTDFAGPKAVPTQTIDAQGNKTNYTVDKLGASTYGGKSLVTKVTQDIVVGGAQSVQNLTYNIGGAANGTVATVKNANNNTTSYGYDSIGNLASVTPPLPQAQSIYTADADNRIKTIKDGNGHTTTYTYDKDDRPLKVAYDDGTYVQYFYDTDGNLTDRKDRDTTFDHIYYDGLNRPIKQNYRGETQTFCYDQSNNLASLTNGGGTVSYGYDIPTGVLTYVTEPGGSGCGSYDTVSTLPPAGSRCIAVKMDQHNRPTYVAYPGGVVRRTDYLNSGKAKLTTTTKGSTSYVSMTFNWNNASLNETDLLQQRTDQMPSPNVDANFKYDGMNRLTDATGLLTNTGPANGFTGTTRDDHWGYDNEGNITKIQTGTITTYLAYDNADQMCYSGSTASPTCATATGSPVTYNYDSNGNWTSSSLGFAASYDAANVTTTMNNTYSGGSAYTAAYPDYGQNPRTSFGNSTAGTTNFTDTILGLSSSQNTTAGKRIDFTRLPDGTLLSMRLGPTTGYNAATTTNSYYSMQDSQHTILGLTDASGGLVARYLYNPFGQDILTDNGNAAAGSTVATDNHMRWLGAYYDYETLLYRFGVRYYVPRLGRFLQPDPKSHSLDLAQQDEFGYAGDTPTTQQDLSGAGFFSAIGTALGVVSTVATFSALLFPPTSGAFIAASLVALTAGEGSSAIGVTCEFASCP